MQILLIEPFYTGSHRQWAEGYAANSRHQVEILSLPGRHWKWRMFGSAVTLSRLLPGVKPDLIIASDMLDLATFRGLAGPLPPCILYFHENQITYPWSPEDRMEERNEQYGFINFTAALAADRIWFNSDYHRTAFLNALPEFLGKYPDHRSLDRVPELIDRSETRWLGLDLASLNIPDVSDRTGSPVLLWNHRWEYDKDPETFFRLCQVLRESGNDFRLIVLGEQFRQSPAIFREAREAFREQIIHWGYVESREAYARLLAKADLLPVTSRQDFFGGSTVEGIYAGAWPLLPNRLAFPNHLPPDRKHANLWSDFSELLVKTQEAFRNLDSIRKEKHFREWVARYDWKIIAPEYDQTAEKLLSQTKFPNMQ